ncbi:hypothetical protein DICPUDRAFT_146609 [Dictyostelium purpureum]|uniref:Pulmonary surfactant-associated protein B n=1 Tax=Dictyostelium purpureum TaxID=5786 RepID=F0Z6E8_DICPU|nr:uncharacterized protein DICPUDRAFT_146609 [Dictyostelium purpureum]EGC40475.1 hypothetical protein DICPUDRAFT_146609 [Dictyostelium purpureum]|eukprot:XP_003283022.1 hypothetical protein DICPUDRAFT_146609 [Dictyostelium purpureum]
MRFLLVLLVAFLALFTGSATAGHVKCEMCEYVIHSATDLIKQNFTTTEIVSNLEHACKFLPHKWTPTCQTVVDVYGLTIISQIINHETPDTICKQIKMCPKNKLIRTEEEKPAMLGFHWKHHHGHNPLKKFECRACDYAVKSAEKHILSGQNTADVERYVDQECNNFEIHEAIHICKKVIHESVNKIVTEIKKHETPGNVCKHTLHMC